MIDSNLYQKAIEQINLQGYPVLQVHTPNAEEPMFFVVYKWQEGYFNTAQSIDFNTVEGINITDFLSKSAAQYLNTSSFISMFNKELDNGTIIRCEFSKGSTWYKWSVVSGGKNVM